MDPSGLTWRVAESAGYMLVWYVHSFEVADTAVGMAAVVSVVVVESGLHLPFLELAGRVFLETQDETANYR